MSTIMQSKANIFSLLPKWWQRNYFVASEEKDSSEYSVGFSFGQLVEVRIPTNGAGEVTEATSHELAHLIDFAMRNQLDRLVLTNYGMVWDKAYINPDKARKRELKVVAIQCHILRLAGFTEGEVYDAMDSIVDGLSGLQLFYGCDETGFYQYCLEQFKAIDPASIEQAWRNALAFLDYKALPVKRRARIDKMKTLAI